MKPRFVHTFIILALFSFACTKSDDNTAPSGPHIYLVVAACDTYLRCPDIVGFRSKTECIAALDYMMTCGSVAEGNLLKTVELTPDLSDADECITWLRDVSCDAFDATPADSPCASLFRFPDSASATEAKRTGVWGLGDDCENDNSCKSGLYCVSGVCQPRPLEGERCTFKRSGERDDCAAGSFCDRTCKPLTNVGDPCTSHIDCGPSLNCKADVCAEKPRIGDACEYREPCDFERPFDDGADLCDGSVCGLPPQHACRTQQHCQSGVCDGYGICATIEQLGGSCHVDAHCAEDEICSGACAPPDCEYFVRGSCIPAECKSDSDCEDDNQCVGGRCQKIAECDEAFDCAFDEQCIDRRCIARPGPGDACTESDRCLEPFRCKSGVCELADLTCEAAAAGEDCSVLGICSGGLFCDRRSNFTCRPRPEIGDTCEGVTTPRFVRWFDPCVADVMCRGGRCLSRISGSENDVGFIGDSGPRGNIAAGDPCTPGLGSSQCADGLACAGPMPTCREEGACIDGTECIDGHTCDFTQMTPEGLGTCVPN